MVLFIRKLKNVLPNIFINRFMFFSDNDPNSRIEKASLDGQERIVIVHKGLSRVLSLTVDLENTKLYWADYGRQTLEGCDYDGTNRRVIRRTNQISMTSLAYHQVGIIYFLFLIVYPSTPLQRYDMLGFSTGSEIYFVGSY